VARASKKDAKKDGSPALDRSGRVAQLRAVWSMTHKADRKLPLVVLGPALAALAVLVVVGILIGHPIYLSVLGVLGALFVGMAIFGRRATGAMYAQVEGQPGAAASVLQTLRGDWHTTPAVAFNRNMDLVHRVVGRPGVVLVAEGSPAPLRQLLTDQKRRVGRVAPETPIYDVIIGDGEGQVPIRKL
jgi:xanthosine utilization system XapX-like protein